MALCNLRRRIKVRINFNSLPYSTHRLPKKLEYKKCCQILGVSESSDQEEIRRAYLMLVKKYHPDNVDGDIVKFQEIDKAFRTIINQKSKERWNVETEAGAVQEQDIKHTAPQHRQYLSYDGVGSGTPFQRQKQYATVRAMQAADNVLQHRISKVTAEENALMKQKVPQKHNIKTKYGFDRLVEDLIQEAMSKGEFNNLAGCGKPLQKDQIRNPYVDFITHKLNEILIENGFTPEWITLQKEIREEIHVLREGLANERQYLGPCPLTSEDNSEWCKAVQKYETLAKNINKKITKYNLVVPVLDKQMFQISLEKEAARIVESGSGKCGKSKVNKIEKATETSAGDAPNFLGLFDYFFRK